MYYVYGSVVYRRDGLHTPSIHGEKGAVVSTSYGDQYDRDSYDSPRYNTRVQRSQGCHDAVLQSFRHDINHDTSFVSFIVL